MRWFARHAWLPTGWARDVLVEERDGHFVSVRPEASAEGATVLPGAVLPGLANAHSHAFHRALRGRTHDDGGTFWTWRERMYAVAARLDPDSYRELAAAAYAEMVLAGVTGVGEFHYLHHGPDGAPYDEPNVMAEALRSAAAAAGLRLTLLDTCYLAGGLTGAGHEPLQGVQRRFGDADADAWAARVDTVGASPGMQVGVAAHSVRAVPAAALPLVGQVAGDRPLHVHLSEQPAENEAALAFYGASPTALLDRAGLLGPGTTAVHATHVAGVDGARLGATGTTVCACPTTERDLADGLTPARTLRRAGAPLSVGSDQHAIVDLFEEARGLETHERLASGVRGAFTPDELLGALTAHGSIGWPDAGRIEVGARADLVAVRLDSPRTAGALPEQVVMAATAADVDTVVVDGRTVVSQGRHVLGDVGALLRRAVEPLWAQA